MKLLILLGVFGILAAGNVYRQPLTRVESRKTKMMKDGTWDAYFQQKQLLQQSFNLSSFKNMNDFDELEYVGNAFIGSPPQPFKIHYDFSSSDFWIPDITCGTIQTPTPYCPIFCSQPGGAPFCSPQCTPGANGSSVSSDQICDQKSKYDSTKSETFHLLKDPLNTTRDYEFGYISLSYVGQDKAVLEAKNERFGLLTVPLATISQAKVFSPVFFDTPFDGLLGLQAGGFMMELGNTKALDKEIFTINLQDNTEYGDIGGYITFGGLDDEHCNAEVIYQSIYAGPYDFSGRNISYGSTRLQEYVTIAFDLSRTSIYGPAESIQKIKESAGVDEDGTIDCDAKIEDITFGDGKGVYDNILTIPAKNLVIHNDDGSCKLALESMPPLNTFQNNKWIFGTSWFRSYCNVFSFALNDYKIGFAKVNA